MGTKCFNTHSQASWSTKFSRAGYPCHPIKRGRVRRGRKEEAEERGGGCVMAVGDRRDCVQLMYITAMVWLSLSIVLGYVILIYVICYLVMLVFSCICLLLFCWLFILYPVAPERIWKWGGAGPEQKWKGQQFLGRAPPLFGSKSTISRSGERFRDGQ